jgi:hypothetical protein
MQSDTVIRHRILGKDGVTATLDGLFFFQSQHHQLILIEHAVENMNKNNRLERISKGKPDPGFKVWFP